MDIRTTPAFEAWLRNLRDRQAQGRIVQRVSRLELGNFGDHKNVGNGIWELRIPHGPGYRVYFLRRGDVLVILLCGGDKSTQRQDIQRAKDLARELED